MSDIDKQEAVRAQANGCQSAFPKDTVELLGRGIEWGEYGLTKREWFAGMAMQAMLHDLDFGTIGNPSDPWGWVATESTKAADALLTALESEATK